MSKNNLGVDPGLPPLPSSDGTVKSELSIDSHGPCEIQDAAKAALIKRIDELEQVCAEAYQVVGSLLSDLGIFETDRAEKVLDNLSQMKMVHDDVLPWPSVETTNSEGLDEDLAGKIAVAVQAKNRHTDIVSVRYWVDSVLKELAQHNNLV